MEHQLKILFPSSLQSSATFQHKKVVCISVLQKNGSWCQRDQYVSSSYKPHG
jgi:hypothetical protein